MIRIKSEKDLQYIEKAIRVGEGVLTRIGRYMRKGITPKYIDRKTGFLALLNNCKPAFRGYQGFPANSCISVNTEIIHCVPDDTPFETGDVVKVDYGIDYKGYISDQARTYIIDNKPRNPNDFRVLYATKVALERAIEQAKPGNYVKDISSAIAQTAKDYGVGILKRWGGHGVGFEVHEAPFIANDENGRDGNVKLKKGMVIAIEPMFVLGQGNFSENETGGIVADGIGCHFEKTVIVR